MICKMRKDQIEAVVFITLGVVAVLLTALRGNILYLLAFAIVAMIYGAYFAQDAGEDNDDF